MAASGSLGRLKDKVKASLGKRRRPPSPGAPAPRTTSAADDHAGTGGIAVSYAPERDGDADPGEVVWAWVPYEEDPTQGKDRPVLVLGWDGPLLAAVQLSSKDHSGRNDAGEWLEVGRGGWDREGRVSYVDAARLLRIEPAGVRREGAALDEDRFHAVLARVRTLHGWTG